MRSAREGRSRRRTQSAQYGEPDASSLQDEAEKLVVFADEDGSAENGGPKTALVADGGLRDVHGADDFVGNAVDLFFFVEGQVRIKFHVQRGREHFGGELFGIFAGDLFGFTERVVLG